MKRSRTSFDQSPSLRRRLPALMDRTYPRAVAQAASESRLPEFEFPAEPPFTLEEVLEGEQKAVTSGP